MRAVCYWIGGVRRSLYVAQAMSEGLRRHGVSVRVDSGFHGGVRGNLAVGYGWAQQRIFEEYRRVGGHYVYIDLGFWKRKPPNRRLEGYHKVVLDGWCPLKSMRRNLPGDRFEALGLEVKESKPGDYIVLAGMSDKSAKDHGFVPEAWERYAISAIRSVSNRPIVYRPKPSWKGASELPGAAFSGPRQPIEDLLAGAHALVTHHSNAAVDAIVAGVPVYCQLGVGSELSMPRIEDVENPPIPTLEQRTSLLQDIAYLQYTPAEMRSGLCWEHMKGLLP